MENLRGIFAIISESRNVLGMKWSVCFLHAPYLNTLSLDQQSEFELCVCLCARALFSVPFLYLSHMHADVMWCCIEKLDKYTQTAQY